MGRTIRTPAGGIEVLAHQHDGDYRITDNIGGYTLGWLRSKPHGSGKVWSWAIGYNDDFAGRYVDMAHAVQGLLSARASLAPSPSSDRGGS